MMTRAMQSITLAAAAMLAVPAVAQESPSARTASAIPNDAVETERLMLSGHGPDDAVPWDFTIDGGRRAGEAATIPVPSNWQQHGFGVYKYGYDSATQPENHGVYRRLFTVPAGWTDRRIRFVFDGVMTDTRVMVNGVLAGPVHQGGFYRFGFDVTKLVKIGGDNVVQVDVSEASANPDTNQAERLADYWVFGGIFRPVWLEATPQQAIEHSAIDARADGAISVDVILAAPREVTRVEAQVVDGDGRAVGAPFSTPIPPGGTGRVRLATHIAAPRLWSAESPNLYGMTLTLYQDARIVHRTHERFGFRTFEVRPGQGLYLNGQRILLKGINRHSFRPDTARTLTRADNYDDVRMIRSMNMNAVRMSHYPPDATFLDAADELGLYVIDELTGWEHAHDTEVGRRLVREMVERDVNHPSIVLWDNGNEGGWNRELDGDFALYDPQGRKVMHPWELHDGVDTKHYPTYADVLHRLAGPNLLMPTEFMHALFDGGGGAGLDDYWRAIAGSPHGAGGFIWAFADEGIARTDRNGRIDTFATRAPDGILGARHEKEPSYYAVKQIWSPVQIAVPTLNANFAGKLRVTNDYDFTPLDAVRFDWSLLRFAKPENGSITPRVLDNGTARTSIAPHGSGDLALGLPSDWQRADALTVTVRNRADDLWTWTWPITGRQASPPRAIATRDRAMPVAVRQGDEVRLSANGVVVRIDAGTGLLRGVSREGRDFELSNGPRLVAIRPKTEAEPVWTTIGGDGAIYRPKAPILTDQIEVKLTADAGDNWTGLTLQVSPDEATWQTIYSGERGRGDGDLYPMPPGVVAAVRIVDPRETSGRPVRVASVRLGHDPARFPQLTTVPFKLNSGAERDPTTGLKRAWVEAAGAGGLDRVRWTLAPDGTLALEYGYTVSGPLLYHGVTFNNPLGDIDAVRGLLDGPTPVWRNRLQGATLGVHVLADRLGSSLPIPEHGGYFAGLRWVRFDTRRGYWTIASATPAFLRVGTPLADMPATTVDFPSGDLSILDAIPAMGSKFISPEDSGPSGASSIATGSYSRIIVFSWPSSPCAKRPHDAAARCIR